MIHSTTTKPVLQLTERETDLSKKYFELTKKRSLLAKELGQSLMGRSFLTHETSERMVLEDGVFINFFYDILRLNLSKNLNDSEWGVIEADGVKQALMTDFELAQQDIKPNSVRLQCSKKGFYIARTDKFLAKRKILLAKMRDMTSDMVRDFNLKKLAPK